MRRRKKPIERAQTGINRLSKILSNMSEATRLEQSIQHSEREPFKLHELVQGCAEGYRVAYRSYQFNTQLNGVEKELEGSPELFAQMLDKIITNAIEFSSEASEITLSMNEKGQYTYLTISNEGPLLPDNMHEQLMDSMVSVREGHHEQGTHLGLGLYIAKIIAEYHKASIQIQNREDETGVEVVLKL